MLYFGLLLHDVSGDNLEFGNCSVLLSKVGIKAWHLELFPNTFNVSRSITLL